MNNGLLSFKYKDIYHAFYNKRNSDYNNLGKKIAIELRTMTKENFELMKELLDKLPMKLEFLVMMSNDNINSASLLDVLNKPDNFLQINTELSETDGYSFMGARDNCCIFGVYVNYVYIIDLDNNNLKIKKIIYENDNDIDSDKEYYQIYKTLFPIKIENELIQTFNFNNIPDFW